MHDTATNTSPLDTRALASRLFYPRPEATRPPHAPGQDLIIPLDDGCSLGARFHPADDAAPTLLFFHGNGEIVSDYDDLGPLFNRAGIHFLPVDYRGYGRSSGRPSASSLVRDCHSVLDFAHDWLAEHGFGGRIAVAGRSLGSVPALELAASRPEEIIALVVESGFARTRPLLWALGLNPDRDGITEADGFRNLDKIGSYMGPTLIIHGQRDRLIPPSNAQKLFDASASADRTLLFLPEADHNTVFANGFDAYLAAVVKLLGATPATDSP